MNTKNPTHHGVTVARMKHNGLERNIYIAVGMFDHHGDGVLVRGAIGLSRESAVISLNNEHNPTVIAFDSEDVQSFISGLTLDSNEGTINDFMNNVIDALHEN